MRCHNGDFCDNQYGTGWKWWTAAEHAALFAQVESMVEGYAAKKVFNADWCADKRASLKGEYGGRCRDKVYEIAMTPTLDKYENACANYVLAAPKFVECNQGVSHTQTLQRILEESVKRDPKSSPLELLAREGCRPFLGREDQTLCDRPMAYHPASVALCKKLVLSGKIKKCQWTDGSSYPPASD